ncbi:YcxB family protein [Nostoc sp. FACHB-87]|uniref:YcxB family protein n=1 Tax=Nostocaceae TaxID=1162 RepID=UPI001684C9D5|nr:MULTISPECIES: YcxB family protein [Nostocaceae]MBD2299288.1 YcxB family protein [Nostoc sp. FACHB-190]MBD2458117.1 YcxB family protein [Nostoc sp. FACHB-87]MBD2479315.1 YcxB family protein [Anabaena sp. FACHB-83]
MYIKTKSFQITPKELGALLTVDYYRRMKFFFILFAILLVINIVVSVLQNRFDWWLIYFVGLGAYFVSLPLFFQPRKRNSTLNFQNRYCEIDENFFAMFYEDGSIVKLNYSHFMQVITKADYYFLYMTKAQFHYLPVAAFESEKDIHRFDLFLQSKQLIKIW